MTEEKNTVMLEGGSFMFKDEGLFFSHPSFGVKKHRVCKAIIMANGLKDLCVVRGKGGELDRTVKRIAESKPEDIMYYPQGDVFWVEFTEKLPDGSVVMIMDLGSAQEEMRPFMRELTRRYKTLNRGKNYEMYAGTDWSE